MNPILRRVLLLGLAITPLFCYLEWGGNNSAFLFEAEYLILFGNKNKADTFTHPLILLPILGQVLILFSAFKADSRRWVVMTGIAFQAILIVFIFLAGAFGLNWKVMLSTFPFLGLSVYYILTSSIRRS
jgi:hypothetical protein